MSTTPPHNPLAPPSTTIGAAEASDPNSSPLLVESDVARLPWGAELIVRGLERTSPAAPARHLRQLLSKLAEQHKDWPECTVTPSTRCTERSLTHDYAFITLAHPTHSNPDTVLLDLVASAINSSNAGLHASWSPCADLNRLRQVNVDSSVSEEVLCRALMEIGINPLHVIPFGKDRTTFLVRTFNDMITVSERPLLNLGTKSVNLRAAKCLPRQTAFPVVIENCRQGGPDVHVLIDRVLRQRFGDQYIGSSNGFDHDVFVAHVRDWSSALNLLSEPSLITTIRNNNGTSILYAPRQLYLANNTGFYLRRTTSSTTSAEVADMHNQLAQSRLDSEARFNDLQSRFDGSVAALTSNWTAMTKNLEVMARGMETMQSSVGMLSSTVNGMLVMQPLMSEQSSLGGQIAMLQMFCITEKDSSKKKAIESMCAELVRCRDEINTKLAHMNMRALPASQLPTIDAPVAPTLPAPARGQKRRHSVSPRDGPQGEDS